MSYADNIVPPETTALNQILPEEPLLLMGAGPVPVPVQVARANGVVINHLGDDMNRVIDAVQTMSRYAFQTTAEKIIGISGPSSAAMEMAICNLLWEKQKVLVCKNGTFSGRFAEMADQIGAQVTIIEPLGPGPITAEQVSDAFEKGNYDVLTVVQGETSSGVETTELQQIITIAKENECVTIVDAVCTLTTMPLPMDDWGIDAVITGGQKGLSSIPGVSLVAFSDEAWTRIENRKNAPAQWVLDAQKAWGFWGNKDYHYTAPVPGIRAIHASIRLFVEETLPQRFKRHSASSEALQAGVEAMGMQLFADKEHRLNSVVAIDTPEGVESYKLRRAMVDRFGVEISGAFGYDIVRIGQMGEQCRPHRLFRTLYALGVCAKELGAELDVAAGMAKLEQKLEELS